ncbi:NADPH-dependent FMN reductase [Brevundimonas sp.]|uniref:NADPH-dependent FMN reductase n=1 Tax=Brevundimonas sp. TaxID=1871086 RepID=UPI003D10CD98
MLIVGMGGTVAPGSSSERVLRATIAACEAAGATTQLFGGAQLDLPAYRYGAARCDRAAALIEALRAADGVVMVSPGYHGTVSGLFKNALDYVEDMAGDPLPYLDGRAVGVIGVASGWQAASATLGTLRTIVHALRGWPTPLGLAVNSAQPLFDDAGQVLDPVLRGQIDLVAAQIVGFAQRLQPHALPARTADARA